jgi:NADPH2:quinone reductase
MRAVTVRSFGPPEGFALENHEERQPGVGEVRVAIAAAGLSYVDMLVTAGRYQVKPPLPYIPGSEFAGIITAAGPDVSAERLGQRVCCQAAGKGLSESAVVSAGDAIPIPDSMSFEEAAVFQVSYATAYYGLVYRAQLKTSESVLVLGAGGAVGFAAVQVAKALGAFVIASASSPEKRALAREGGADLTVDSGAEDWRTALREANGGAAIDVVFDPVAGPTMESGFRSLGWGGRYLMVGFASGEIPSLRVNLPLLKGASMIGVDLRQAFEKNPPIKGKIVAALFDFYARGLIKPKLSRIYPLSDYVTAMNLVASGRSAGRVVLSM